VFRQRPRLTVQPILHVPRPGEDLEVAITIDAPARTAVQEGRLDLRLRATYGVHESRPRREDLVSERVQFLPAGDVEAGERTVPVTLRIPEGVPSAFEGDLLRLEWGVAATLALPRRRDVHASATLHVVGDPPAAALGAPAVTAAALPWGEAFLAVEPQVARQGDTLGLVVDIRASSAATPSLRADLRHVEEVQIGGRTATDVDVYGSVEIVAGGPFAAGQNERFTAALEVPAQPSVPTTTLAGASARWEVVLYDGADEIAVAPVDIWARAPR
jgi:hypothetical protein